jgi:hypothetical protein
MTLTRERIEETRRQAEHGGIVPDEDLMALCDLALDGLKWREQQKRIRDLSSAWDTILFDRHGPTEADIEAGEQARDRELEK